MMQTVKGISGAPGYASSKAAILRNRLCTIEKLQIGDVNREIRRLNEARIVYGRKLDAAAQKSDDALGSAGMEIINAYKEMMQDDFFFGEIQDMIRTDHINAEYAVDETRIRYTEKLLNVEDEYLRGRADDINHVCRELIGILQGEAADGIDRMQMNEPFILVAEDLSPVDTIAMDKSLLRGIITEKGGRTSHSAILAKILGIPYVCGAADIFKRVRNQDKILLDGNDGMIVIQPDPDTERSFLSKMARAEELAGLYQIGLKKPARCSDGRIVRVCANAGSHDSIETLDAGVCDGIGLFRTEFLYMESETFPSEEEQFRAYRRAVEKCGDKEVIIRTLDIGGDKTLPYLELPKENNPFLGYRAIRLYRENQALFATQIRAILRASAYGNVKMMLPMIANLEELREIRQFTEKIKDQLRAEGVLFDPAMPIGIMIETPAAALLSDKLAEEAQFFSIGSNDLIQYITAADRENEYVQNVYDCYNVSVLRAIRMVCENAHKNHIPVGICGEDASNSLLVPLWIAMGVDELSMAPSRIPEVKYVIRQTDVKDAAKLADTCLDTGSIADVVQALKEYNRKITKTGL